MYFFWFPAFPESESRFRLTIFVCTGVALVLLTILLVLLILCVRNRSRSSALSLGPEFPAPGDYWSNYRQWAGTDFPASVKPYYDAGQPSTSMHPGHMRPVGQERLVWYPFLTSRLYIVKSESQTPACGRQRTDLKVWTLTENEGNSQSFKTPVLIENNI